MTMQRVAFYGLGCMGRPMAVNLTKKLTQARVLGFDAFTQACDNARAAGVEVASSAHEAADGAHAVVSMLPTGKHAADLYLGEGGLLNRLAPSTVIADCSTIDVSTAKEIAAAAAERGIHYVDSPVSGGTAAAAAGTLSFMVGTDDVDAFERTKPILSAMGKAVFHAGPAGAGQVAKACNNMLLAIHMIGTCEALAMGSKHGLKPEDLSEILKASSGNNWSLQVYNPYPGVMPAAPASKGYEPGFQVDLMVKDLGLAMEVAQRADLECNMGAMASQIYKAHQDAGSGALDFSSVCQKVLGH